MPAPSTKMQQQAWTQDRIDLLQSQPRFKKQPAQESPFNQRGPIEDDSAKHGAVRPIIPESPARIVHEVIELRQRHLLLPLRNLRKENLRDSFDESRRNHMHEAIDILAPRNTAIVAVEDGSIARLWYSVREGITIYQLDPEQKYE